MVHKVNGFDLKFISRTGWKAERRYAGESVDIVPVTWTKGWKKTPQGVLLEVWFRDPEEAAAHNSREEAFVVALAAAKDYSRDPLEFSHFTSLFRVVPTGTMLTEKSIQTRVLESVKA